MPLTFSIITVAKNSAKTIGRTVQSVSNQQYVSFRHVIKDAVSNDATIKIAVDINPSIHVISKPDIGIYDAMNQGFEASDGDVIAYLNSDDYYSDRYVLRDVSTIFESEKCDYVYGDIRMVSREGKIIREWKTGDIGEYLDGRQIPHPALFIKRALLEKLELPFDPTYKISADLKQQLIIINRMKARGVYLNRCLVVMEIGGESTRSFSSYYKGWSESYRAYREVIGRGGLMFVIRKVLSKIRGFRAARKEATKRVVI